MNSHIDKPKVIAYCIIIYIVFYLISLILSVKIFNNSIISIIGSVLIALIFVFIFLLLIHVNFFKSYFYTNEKLTNDYIVKLLFAFFCVVYGVVSYAVYAIYSKKIAICLYFGLFIVGVFAGLYDKAKTRL